MATRRVFQATLSKLLGFKEPQSDVVLLKSIKSREGERKELLEAVRMNGVRSARPTPVVETMQVMRREPYFMQPDRGLIEHRFEQQVTGHGHRELPPTPATIAPDVTKRSWKGFLPLNGGPFITPATVMETLKTSKIDAVKQYRLLTGCTLKDAVDVINRAKLTGALP